MNPQLLPTKVKYPSPYDHLNFFTAIGTELQICLIWKNLFCQLLW